VAYNDWPRELQDIWDNTPGTDSIPSDWEEDYFQELFETGFRWHAEEYDALGIDIDEVYAARQRFFDDIGLNEDRFDWDEWRDYMGYNEQ
jgi:hypothetical protein